MSCSPEEFLEIKATVCAYVEAPQGPSSDGLSPEPDKWDYVEVSATNYPIHCVLPVASGCEIPLGARVYLQMIRDGNNRCVPLALKHRDCYGWPYGGGNDNNENPYCPQYFR